MSFKWQALFSLGLTGGYAVLAFAISVVTARILGIDAYGIYASVIAHALLLSALIVGGLPQLVVREVTSADHAGNEALLRGVIRRAQSYVIAGSLASAIVAALVWLALAPDDGWWTAFWPALAVVVGISILNVQNAILRGLSRPLSGQVPDVLVRPVVHLSLLVMLGMGTAAVLPHQAVWAFLAATGVALVWSFTLMRSVLRPRPVMAPIFQDRAWLIALSTFFVSGGLFRVHQQLGPVMLEHLSDREQVALFQPAFQMIMVLMLCRQAVGMVLIPLFKRALLDEDRAKQQGLITQGASAAAICAALIGAGLLALGPAGIGFIFGPGFGALYPVMVVMVIGHWLVLFFGQPGLLLNQAGFEKITALTSLLTVGLTLAIGIALAPAYGALGAGIAVSISQLVATIWQARVCRHRMGLRPEAFDLLRWIPTR